MYICIYVYIYIERERCVHIERSIDKDIDMHITQHHQLRGEGREYIYGEREMCAYRQIDRSRYRYRYRYVYSSTLSAAWVNPCIYIYIYYIDR